MASPVAYRYVARAISPLRGTERPRGNIGRSVDGQSILYESITQVPTDLEGGLKPVEARETLPSPAKCCLGWAARKGGLTRICFHYIALMRSLPGNATCELKLDLGHWRRRLVGVSVNCHTKIQDFSVSELSS